MLLCFAACGEGNNSTDSAASTTSATGSETEENTVEKTGVWADAVLLKDTTVGKGDKTIKVEISAEKQVITLTVKTNAETVGAALLENEIIEGEDSEFGLYVKKVNGITADFDVNKAYWAFYIDGGYASSGVDTTTIDEDVTYKLEYTK